MRNRSLTNPEKAWGKEEITKTEIPIQIDSYEIANAINKELGKESSNCNCSVREDAKLIRLLTFATGALAGASILCAIISLIVASSNARTISILLKKL